MLARGNGQGSVTLATCSFLSSPTMLSCLSQHRAFPITAKWMVLGKNKQGMKSCGI